MDPEGNQFSFKQWRDGMLKLALFSLSFRSSPAYSASPGSQPPLPESPRCFSSSLSLSLWSCLSSGSWWARQSFRQSGARNEGRARRGRESPKRAAFKLDSRLALSLAGGLCGGPVRLWLGNRVSRSWLMMGGAGSWADLRRRPSFSEREQLPRSYVHANRSAVRIH